MVSIKDNWKAAFSTGPVVVNSGFKFFSLSSPMKDLIYSQKRGKAYSHGFYSPNTKLLSCTTKVCFPSKLTKCLRSFSAFFSTCFANF